MEVVLSNQIYVPKQDLNPGLRNRLLRLTAFQNPEFYKAQAMRLSTYDKPRVVACAEDLGHHIGLPRGCLDDVRTTLTDLGIRMAIRDERSDGSPLELSFQGELRREQKTAADAMLRHETGVLAATTAFGKTVVAAWLTRNGASTRSCWSIDASYSINGSRGSRPSSVCLSTRSAASAEAEVDRLGGLMSASYRVSSATEWSLTSSPITAT